MAVLVLLHHVEDFTPRDFNPVALKKFVNNLSPEIEHVKRRTNGVIGVYIQPDNSALLKALQETTNINRVPVVVHLSAEATLLKGVISHTELALLSSEGIQELLEDKKKQAAWKLSDTTALLTWSKKILLEGLPDYIVLG